MVKSVYVLEVFSFCICVTSKFLLPVHSPWTDSNEDWSYYSSEDFEFTSYWHLKIKTGIFWENFEGAKILKNSYSSKYSYKSLGGNDNDVCPPSQRRLNLKHRLDRAEEKGTVFFT